MTNDYENFRFFCSCKDCIYFQCVPPYNSFFDETIYYCGRVWGLGVVKRIDPMRDPCKLFILSLYDFDFVP